MADAKARESGGTDLDGGWTWRHGDSGEGDIE